MTRPGINAGKDTAGMTLIELMIAMTIGSGLLIGAINVYAQARSVYRTAESLARLEETLRFAHGLMKSDIQLAAYWGRTNQTANITRGPAVRVSCNRRDVTDWALDIMRGIEARDEHYDLPCPGIDARDRSDVLVVRHAVPGEVTPTDGGIQIQSNGRGGRIFSTGVPPADFKPGGTVHDVAVNAWYVSDRSKYDAGLPALRRRSLVRGVMQDQEMIAGVENLQVRFGIDTDGDDAVDAYVDGDDPAARRPENRILAVRLWLLARSDVSEAGRGHRDNHVYRTPDADRGPIAPADRGDYPPEYRRASTAQTIFLRNTRRAAGPPDEAQTPRS